MKKTVIFYLLCLVTIFCFFMASNLVNKPKPYILPLFNTMNVVIEAKTKTPTDIIIKINDKYSEIPNSKNVLNKTIRQRVKTLDVLVKDGYEEKIKDIVIFNDIKVHYFKDFSNFEKEKIELCPMDKCYKYTKYKIPDSVKWNKDSFTYNYRGTLNMLCSKILTIFSGHLVFVIPYILLFISIIYFINNNETIKKPKIKGWVILLIVGSLALFLRLNGLFDYEPWADEYWSLHFSDPNSPISRLFADAGNPPLFYIILKAYLKVFGYSLVSIKMLPFTIGILGLFCLWFFLYKTYGKKEALLGLFIASINAPLIYYSSEVRSYILQVLFTPVLIYFLFKILKEKNNINFIIYAFLVAIVSNIHYYEIFFVLFNFMYGGIYLLVKKRGLDFIKFLISNVLGGLFFLPFFIKTAFKGALMDSGFNTWLPSLTFEQIKSCTYYIFGGFLSFLFSIAFFVRAFFKEKNKTIIIYSLLAISFIIIFGIVASYFIRPMLLDRYFLLAIPLFIIFLVGVFTSFSSKYSIIFCIIWLLIIQNGIVQKSYSANSRKMVLQMPYDIAYQYPENRHVYVVSNTLLDEQKKYSKYKKGVNYLVYGTKEANKNIENILKKDKSAVVFTGMILPQKQSYGEKYTCLFNSASDMCLWRIENEK